MTSKLDTTARWLIGIIITLIAATFTYAIGMRADMATVQAENRNQENRINRLEQKIDEGFQRILDELRQRK
jgi:hypothetical protein